MEVTSSERDLLHPLFVALRDRRALLRPAQTPVDEPEITVSIEAIRADLTAALKSLGPDAPGAGEVELLRQACRAYLDTVGHPCVDREMAVESALEQLQGAFRETAAALATDYDLPSARELAHEMSSAGLMPAEPMPRRPSRPSLLAHAQPIAGTSRDRVLWGQEQLAALERQLDMSTVWIIGQDFRSDLTSGMPFHDAIRHNIFKRDITYVYVGPARHTLRLQLESLRRLLDLPAGDPRLRTALLDQDNWNRLPYTAGNVTIYDPLAAAGIPVGFFWYPGADGESFGQLGDYVVLRWIDEILEICPSLAPSDR
jgi:hypothetical protein